MAHSDFGPGRALDASRSIQGRLSQSRASHPHCISLTHSAPTKPWTLTTRICARLVKIRRLSVSKLALGAAIGMMLAGQAAASEVWVTDKVISEGSEHDYKAIVRDIQVTPNGNFVVSWTTPAPFTNDWYGHSAEFTLDGQRLRKVMSLSPTQEFSFQDNLQCAISPDSTILSYVWNSTNELDSLVYHMSLWFQSLDYASGTALAPAIRLDTSNSYPFTTFVDGQRIEFISDSSVVVFWRENSYGIWPEYSARFLQRVSIPGQTIGDRLDLYTTEYYSCDSVDTCRKMADQFELEFLENRSLLVVHDGGAYLGGPYGNTYSLGRIVDTNLVPLPGVDILMCDGLPCSVFTGFWGVSQFPDVDKFKSGGFAVAVNIGYDVDIENYPAGRAFDSLFQPNSPVMGASDHPPRESWFAPKVACGPNDEYVVVWTDRGESDNALRDVWAQRFHRSGIAIGINQRLNGIIDVGSGNPGQMDAACIGGHLVVVHHGRGAPFGIGGDGYLQYPMLLQVMPWDKVGYYAAGDPDQSGAITATDIIQTVNYVFKSGPAPKPQSWAAATDGDCTVSASDIIYSVNYVFKGGPAPVSDCAPEVPYVP